MAQMVIRVLGNPGFVHSPFNHDRVRKWIGTWVDDFKTVAGHDKMDSTKAQIRKVFGIENRGPINFFLGCIYNHDLSTNTIHIGQPHYVDSIV